MPTKTTSGMTQGQREANCQARLKKFRALKPHERERMFVDEMNYSLNGGLRGLVHAAKTYANDETKPEAARQMFSEAAGWGGWAMHSQKNPWVGEMRLAAAVKCASLVSQATRTFAIGWVGNGLDEGNL